MKLLSLDIGTRRTGVAYGETKQGIIIALDTIHHESEEELIGAVATLINARGIEKLVIGMPTLPDGSEGKQAGIVRAIASQLQKRTGRDTQFLDERYSSQEEAKKALSDPDARAACQLLQTALSIENSGRK